MTPVLGGEKDSWMPSLLSRLGGGSAAPAFPSTPTMFLRYEPTNPDNEFDSCRLPLFCQGDETRYSQSHN
jgi:hypothetical protein